MGDETRSVRCRRCAPRSRKVEVGLKTSLILTWLLAHGRTRWSKGKVDKVSERSTQMSRS